MEDFINQSPADESELLAVRRYNFMRAFDAWAKSPLYTSERETLWEAYVRARDAYLIPKRVIWN